MQNPTAPELLEMQFKQDGWMNLMSGLGRMADKSRHTTFEPQAILTKEELTAIWNGNGLGSRIVSAVAEDMTRAWVSLPEDKAMKVEKELDRLKVETVVYEAILWQRLYGGSIIVIGDTQSESLEEPLPATLKGITVLKTYPKSRIDIYSSDINKDPRSPNFEEVEFYNVRGRDGNYFRAHQSRVLVFKGLPYADDTHNVSWEDLYWGMSVLQQPWDEIKTFGSTMQGVANLLQEFVVGVFKLSNLAQMLAEGQEERITKRMNIIAQSKSLINAVLLGEGEEFDRNSATISGMPEIIDRFMMMVSGVTGIPVTRLFGRSAAGLNATGENDMQQYYDKVGSEQKTKLRPALQRLLNLIGGYTAGMKEVGFEFLPLWTPSQPELLEMKAKQATIDKTYVDMGVYDADEVRASRFEGGYSFDTAVEGPAPEEEPPAVPQNFGNNKEKPAVEEE